MLHFAIVEDQEAEQRILVHYLERWAQSVDLPLKLLTFSHVAAFQFALPDLPFLDALFLDIQMPGLSGIDLARELRASGWEMPIVFVTGLVDYIQEGYELAALNYLLKPIRYETLERTLNRLLRERREEGEGYVLKTDEGFIRLKKRDILYLESQRNQVIFKMYNGEQYELRASLSDLANELKTPFFLCHRSYLVNLAYVSKLSPQGIELDTGERLPVSRRRLAALSEAYLAFHQREGS